MSVNAGLGVLIVTSVLCVYITTLLSVHCSTSVVCYYAVTCALPYTYALHTLIARHQQEAFNAWIDNSTWTRQ